jgi:hypothetical protein
MNAAVSVVMAASSASGLLNGTCEKPGTSGPNRSRYSGPHVAESAPIVLPWKPRIVATMPVRFVAARANFRAPSTASVPLLQRKNRSRDAGRIAASTS